MLEVLHIDGNQYKIAFDIYMAYIDYDRKLKMETDMRVSRVQAEENRETVINVASKLFRERGFDGIGLKDVMASAGLTQGAFYKQFKSKEDLTAQASTRAFEGAAARWEHASREHPEDPIGAIIDFYLTRDHRLERQEGCPIVALGADAARQSEEVRASFEAGIRNHLRILSEASAGTDHTAASIHPMAILSTMVGAVLLSRAVNDEVLSDEILEAAAASIRSLT